MFFCTAHNGGDGISRPILHIKPAVRCCQARCRCMENSHSEHSCVWISGQGGSLPVALGGLQYRQCGALGFVSFEQLQEGNMEKGCHLEK